ncbi:MAG: GTP 3',8-cyclase MoaA, partial [Thermoplasmata archaeon]|nr:GTP 3',8-cyclase MoaA [Thermoplasmata archaeon]
ARGGHNIRFIELMPTGTSCFDHKTCFVDGAEIRAYVERVGRLIPRERPGSGAEEYLLEGSSALIGFIQSVSRPFCSRCNRLRLTATGLLKPCLYSDLGVDLMPDLRDGGDTETLKCRIREVALAKPEGHEIGKKDYCFRMHEIGG